MDDHVGGRSALGPLPSQAGTRYAPALGLRPLPRAPPSAGPTPTGLWPSPSPLECPRRPRPGAGMLAAWQCGRRGGRRSSSLCPSASPPVSPPARAWPQTRSPRTRTPTAPGRAFIARQPHLLQAGNCPPTHRPPAAQVVRLPRPAGKIPASISPPESLRARVLKEPRLYASCQRSHQSLDVCLQRIAVVQDSNIPLLRGPTADPPWLHAQSLSAGLRRGYRRDAGLASRFVLRASRFAPSRCDCAGWAASAGPPPAALRTAPRTAPSPRSPARSHQEVRSGPGEVELKAAQG